MALKHLPENPRQEARAWNLQLGVPGFKYADLNRVRSLEALDKAFLSDLRQRGPLPAAANRVGQCRRIVGVGAVAEADGAHGGGL